MGYETKVVPTESLEDFKTNIIELKPKIELLNQVVIKGKKTTRKEDDARTLVRKSDC